MTSFHLKIIAGLCMLMDHIAVVFLEPALAGSGYSMFGNMLSGTPLHTTAVWYTIFRLIGRLAFPIYAFQIAEGIQRTSNKRRYQMRLLLGAFLSEIPFDLTLMGKAIDWSHQNVMITLLLGAVAIDLYEREWKQQNLKWLFPILAAVLAQLTKSDYGALGVAIIFLFHALREDEVRRTLALIFPLVTQYTAVLALILINMYKGEKGRSAKWLWYLWYPGHLAGLYLMKLFLL